jgi:hypothetical protein
MGLSHSAAMLVYLKRDHLLRSISRHNSPQPARPKRQKDTS